jgi:hypothetical protein
MNDNRGTNEWDGDEGVEDNIPMDGFEQQKELEEAHQHFLIRDFGELVLELGPNAVINQMDNDARQELSMAFNNLKKGE